MKKTNRENISIETDDHLALYNDIGDRLQVIKTEIDIEYNNITIEMYKKLAEIHNSRCLGAIGVNEITKIIYSNKGFIYHQEEMLRVLSAYHIDDVVKLYVEAYDAYCNINGLYDHREKYYDDDGDSPKNIYNKDWVDKIEVCDFAKIIVSADDKDKVISHPPVWFMIIAVLVIRKVFHDIFMGDE